MIDNGWSGNLVSEYEGPVRFTAERSYENFGFAMQEIPEQVRRHQIMMRNLLGY